MYVLLLILFTEYLVVFELKESEEDINDILRETLTELNFDFVEKENKILLNSFYFTNLKNIMEILEIKTVQQYFIFFFYKIKV